MQPRSTRLNKDNKFKFVQAVLEKHLPEEKLPSLNDFRTRWKDKVYDIAYGPFLQQMQALPEYMFERSSSIRILINGEREYFDLGKKVLHAWQSSYSVAALVPDDHLMAQEHKQLQQQIKDYRLQRSKLETQLQKLVNSCNTSGQLYEAWPEAEKFADCFPYKAPNKHQCAKVSATEMQIGLNIAKATVVLPGEN